MFYVTSNDGTKIAVYDYNRQGRQTKDLIVSSDLSKIQHESIRGSKLITLPDSGHGIVYDQMKKFNSIFMDAIAD